MNPHHMVAHMVVCEEGMVIDPIASYTILPYLYLRYWIYYIGRKAFKSHLWIYGAKILRRDLDKLVLFIRSL